MMPFFTGQLPVQRGGGRRSGSLALASQDCSTSETFSPRTVLTDNICTCVQQILKQKQKNTLKNALNLPNMMPSFPVQRGGGRRSGSLVLASQDCSTSEAFSPRTVLTDNICTCVQQILQYVTTKMPFLTTSTITYSCLALVAPQADSW